MDLKAITVSSSKDIFWYERYLFSVTQDDYYLFRGPVYFS